MTHKILKLTLVALIPFIISSCGINTKDWSVVKLNAEMTIKVPPDWILTKVDGKIIFSDLELDQPSAKIYMMEVDIQQDTLTYDLVYSNPLFYGTVTKELKSEMNSDSTYFLVEEVKSGNQTKQYRLLEYHWHYERIMFIVMDPDLKSSVLKTILHSWTFE